jgi:hypothetical protein
MSGIKWCDVRRAAVAAGLGLLVLLAVNCTAVLSAEPAGKEAAKEKAIETQGEKAAPAAAVDFAAALGLSVENLKTLGARIDQARGAMDPVGLLSAAQELAAAEKVAKKQASVKSEPLIKQAVEMAKRRQRPDELRMVAQMVTDDKTADELQEQAEKVAAAIKDRKEGATTRGIQGYLFVNNRTAYYIEVYIDYNYVGVVEPYSLGRVFVGQGRWESTYLFAKAPGTDSTWGPTVVSHPVSDHTWTLTY